MADDTADTERATGKRNYTAPKGRPTRPRSAVDDQRRVFGPVAQWLTFALLLLIAVLVLIIITQGNDLDRITVCAQVLNEFTVIHISAAEGVH
jgi:hypothetical protein